MIFQHFRKLLCWALEKKQRFLMRSLKINAMMGTHFGRVDMRVIACDDAVSSSCCAAATAVALMPIRRPNW